MRNAAALLPLLLAACAVIRPEEEVIQEAKDKVFPAVVFVKPIQKEFRGGRMEKVQVFGSGAIISPAHREDFLNALATRTGLVRDGPGCGRGQSERTDGQSTSPAGPARRSKGGRTTRASCADSRTERAHALVSFHAAGAGRDPVAHSPAVAAPSRAD